MLQPVVFAIFVLCSADLLDCEYQPGMTKSFGTDVAACKEHVAFFEADRLKYTILGKCKWHIP